MDVPVNDVTPVLVIVTSVAEDEKEMAVPFTNPFVARLGPAPSLTRDSVPALESETLFVDASSIIAVVGDVNMIVMVRVAPSPIAIGLSPTVNV